MYKKRHTYRAKTQNGQSSFNRNGHQFRGKGRKPVKKLDSNLFIKKAAHVDAKIYTSLKTFSDFPLTDKLKRNILDHGYERPTEIQEKTIPYLLEGRDVIGIANTGTGKTAAFLIPLVNKVFADRNERVLIVTPTRELAMQIADELRVFVKGMDLEIALCIGGSNMERQEKKLRHNPHFIIGTPGRLRDLIERRRLNLDLFRNIVLDEVDRMLDIGFINDVKYFISLLPKKRQSLFFSATISQKVKEILSSFVTDPITISVKQQDTSENVEQNIVKVEHGGNKVDQLHDLLANDGFDKVLIFGRTKWGVEKLTKELITRGFKAAAIHGNKTQGQRQRALEQFKQSDVRILLATDVASRGLDIENVTHVINYDAPESYDDYVHRIGRTGRAGRKGTALTFVE
ncbi:MAG TPA: DEAD/DEAH box helicase [Candidatus Saccharimonadales bacterium]|nr:DEAD/DEAH box helicase [Candidatus Saccharimonadales bacterium]